MLTLDITGNTTGVTAFGLVFTPVFYVVIRWLTTPAREVRARAAAT